MSRQRRSTPNITGNNTGIPQWKWCGEACTQSEAQQQGSDDADGATNATNLLQCKRCRFNGRFEVASTFCSTCTYYFCSDCAGQHDRQLAFKDHILLRDAAMPTEKPRGDIGEDECTEHCGKLIELYCHSDHTLACVLCIVESHMTCADVTAISNLSTHLKQSPELIDFKISSMKQKLRVVSCRKIINEYKVLNASCYDKSVEQFETFKSKIKADLHLIGKRIYREARELKESNEKKLESLSESLNYIEQELEALMSDIEAKERMEKLDKLFIAIKNYTKDIARNGQKLDAMNKDTQIQMYTFDVEHSLKQIQDKMVSTCKMKSFSGDVHCTAEIKVKGTEEADCSISGLVELSPTEIVAADYINNCLKHIDVDKKVIVTRQKLGSGPRDVSMISGSRVAVTLPNEHIIQYFNTQNELAPCGGIQVDGMCWAIKSTEDTLIVSFLNPGKIEMMTYRGQVKRSFTMDSRYNRLFDYPGYLCLSPDLTGIYISDIGNDAVTCLSMDGRVNWKYKGRHVVREVGGKEQKNEGEHGNDDEEFSPRGLATDTVGCLYICSYKTTNSIHVVSPRGIRLKIIRVAQHRIRYPWAICYSKMQASLYVSSWRRGWEYHNFIRRLSFQNEVK